jgi:hypothetical protein
MMRTEPVTADSVPVTADSVPVTADSVPVKADKAGDEGMRTWLNES